MKTKINNLILEVNALCNCRCVYCYLPEHTASGKGTLKYFIKALKKYSKKGIRNLEITGGEPTLYPHLFEIIAWAKKMRYPNITLVSNGRKIADSNYCKQLIALGITRFVFCLDGPNNKIFDRVSKQKKSFTLVAKAVKNIKKISQSMEVCITTVINHYNYQYVSAIIKKALALGVDLVNIQYLLPYIVDKRVGCRKVPAQVFVSYKDSFPYVKKAIDRYTKKIKINLNFIPYCYVRGYEKYLEKDMLKDDRQIIHYDGFEYNIGTHLQKGCIKTAECKTCRYETKCLGFFKSYAEELGITELKHAT